MLSLAWLCTSGTAWIPSHLVRMYAGNLISGGHGAGFDVYQCMMSEFCILSSTENSQAQNKKNKKSEKKEGCKVTFAIAGIDVLALKEERMLIVTKYNH